jgi:peptidoglycan hydrolase-like protein with peptidoglycan-binding domain
MQPLVRQGNTGQTVRNLQTLLNFVKTFPAMLAVDGIFGPRTHGRVTEFQRQAALLVDGVVGPRTAAALASAAFSKLSRR